MFSNKQISSLATSSDERCLKLSEDDWKIVLDANRQFSQRPELWRGSRSWGKYLLYKIGETAKNIDFHESLELCSGNGFLYFSFRDLFQFGNEAHFIDLSAEQCKAFENRCRNSGIDVPDIICGDIGRLPFGDSSLDLVYGHSFLHHLPDVGKYLEETCRVLKKGGKFITFHEPTSTAPFLESFPRTLFKTIDSNSLTDIWLIKPEVITDLLHKAGFSKIEIHPNGLIASLLVTPWQLILDKLGFQYQPAGLSEVLMCCNGIEHLMGKRILFTYAPSIAIVATK